MAPTGALQEPSLTRSLPLNHPSHPQPHLRPRHYPPFLATTPLSRRHRLLSARRVSHRVRQPRRERRQRLAAPHRRIVTTKTCGGGVLDGYRALLGTGGDGDEVSLPQDRAQGIGRACTTTQRIFEDVKR